MADGIAYPLGYGDARATGSSLAANLGLATARGAAGIARYSVTLSPAAVAANTTAEQIFAVAGVAVGQAVFVNKPSAQAGLGIVGARVSSAGNVGITFSNNTAGSITPTAAETYLVVAV